MSKAATVPVSNVIPFAAESLVAYAMLQWEGYKPADHHRRIASKLHAVERGEIKRLMIFMPPRAGKSMLVSEFFPAWYIGRSKEKQIIHCTYAQELADGFGRKIRNQISDPLFQAVFPGVALANDSQAANRFSTTAGSIYHAVGAGGPITGRGAHCVAKGTLVQTLAGEFPIDELKIGTSSGMIMTWNQSDKCHEYKELQAITHRQTDGVYRITTTQGRVLEVTGNHLIFSAGRFVRADTLSAGNNLLCVLPSGINQASVQHSKSIEAWAQRFLLRENMFGISSRNKKQKAMREMRKACARWWSLSRSKVLQVMQTSKIREETRSSGNYAYMPNMQRRVQGSVAWERCKRLCNILQQALLGDRALYAYVGQGESKMEAWSNPIEAATSFSKSIQRNEEAHLGERWTRLRGLQDEGNEIACSSHRQLADEQFSVKPCDALLQMPLSLARCEGFKTVEDTVALVERLHKETTVYDIQVADNHNFYASGVLVHNCLLIDDPIKGREDADSETQRRKLQDWYKSVAYTRLMPGGAIVIIQTRWHTDDLSGWILREHGHEDWDVLSLPAIDDDGNALWPEAFPLERLKEIRKTIGERDWSALYQQRPTVDGGNILKTNWWQLWPKGRKLPKCDHVFVSWDTAYSTKDSKNSAHSAYSIWGVFWDEQEQRYSLMLLGAKSGQWDYPELRKQLIALDKEHSPDMHLIEKKASGMSLLQDMRRIGIPVRGYQPDRDKVSRAYAVQAMLESGQIWRPQKQWAEEFMAHLAAFPNGAPPSADYTDTATQAWLYTRNGYWMSGHPDDDGYAQRNKAPVKDPETEEWLEDNEKDIRRGVYG